MKNRISLNSEVSLVEIIMSILIFAIAGAIMLNCFGSAKFIQMKTNDKVEAGNKVQSIAEMIKSFDTGAEADKYMAENFKFLKTDGTEKVYVNYYDTNWNICEDINKEYNEFSIEVRMSDVSSGFAQLREFVISSEKINPYPFVSKSKEACKLYEIETKRFFSVQGGSNGK